MAQCSRRRQVTAAAGVRWHGEGIKCLILSSPSPSPSPSRCNCITVEGVYDVSATPRPPTYACKCSCICSRSCICVTGNSPKHKSQICRMPHGDTRATGDRQAVQGDGEGGGTAGCEGRRTATGNWQRYIHITGMARRHLATHSHVTHAASTGALALSLPLPLPPYFARPTQTT